jgi:hypothetical protein
VEPESRELAPAKLSLAPFFVKLVRQVGFRGRSKDEPAGKTGRSAEDDSTFDGW